MADDQGPRCVRHAERAATLSCERCGDFVCDDCQKEVGARKVCEACTRVDGVDYLEAYKKSLWGKRDGFVWLFGGLGTAVTGFYLVALGITLVAALPGGGDALALLIPLLVLTVTFAVNLAYLLLQRWARLALLLLPVLSGGVVLLIFAAMGSGAETLGPLFASYLLPFLFALAAYVNPRNKLAFKIDIPQAKLEKLYSVYRDNLLARYGLNLGVLGLVIPPLALIGLPLSIVGLRRVDPEAWPPVGGRGSAIGGIVLSSLAVLGYGALLLWLNLS